MGKKNTIEEVREFANKKGFEVLDDKYINSNTTMKFKCASCGFILERTFTNLKDHNKCPNCNSKAVFYTYPFEKAVELVNTLGFEVLSDKTEWVGTRTKLKIKCKKCKSEISRQFRVIQKSEFKCLKCNENSKAMPYEKVKKYVEVDSESGCEFLTTKEEYYSIKKAQPKSSLCKFKFKCKCGIIFERTFNSFKSDKIQQCNDCSGYSRHTIESVQHFVEVESNSGCKLLSNIYVSYHKPLHFQCACGNEFIRTYSEFKSGKLYKCKECTGAYEKYTYEEVKTLIEDNGLTLLSTEYKNNRQKLKLQCYEGHGFERNLYDIKKFNYTCPYCNKKGYKRSTDQLSKEIEEITNGEYQLLSEYKTMNSKVRIRHINCNTIWEVTPHNFLDGETRCPFCKISKGELFIKQFLDIHNIPYTCQYTFPDLKGDYDLLKFDFAIFEDIEKQKLKMLIEYDGEFHYLPVMGQDELEHQQRYDGYKNNYCKNNKICLIRIPYWEFNDLENILNKICTIERK